MPYTQTNGLTIRTPTPPTDGGAALNTNFITIGQRLAAAEATLSAALSTVATLTAEVAALEAATTPTLSAVVQAGAITTGTITAGRFIGPVTGLASQATTAVTAGTISGNITQAQVTGLASALTAASVVPSLDDVTNAGAFTNNGITVGSIEIDPGGSGTMAIGGGYLTKDPGNPFQFDGDVTIQGTTLADNVHSTGPIYCQSDYAGTYGIGGGGLGTGNGAFAMKSWEDTIVTGVFQGHSTNQSADLTQWQSSDGTALVKVTAAGSITATSFSGSGASLTSLNASSLASGTVPTARLGSGTASSSTYLRGDQTWAAISSLPAATLQQVTDAGNTTTNSATFGPAYVGPSTSFSGTFAEFGYTGLDGSNSYALLQGSLGETYLNAAPGSDIHLRIGNLDSLTIDLNRNATFANNLAIDGLLGSYGGAVVSFGAFNDPAPGVAYDAKFGGPGAGIAVAGDSLFNGSVTIGGTELFDDGYGHIYRPDGSPLFIGAGSSVVAIDYLHLYPSSNTTDFTGGGPINIYSGGITRWYSSSDQTNLLAYINGSTGEAVFGENLTVGGSAGISGNLNVGGGKAQIASDGSASFVAATFASDPAGEVDAHWQATGTVAPGNVQFSWSRRPGGDEFWMFGWNGTGYTNFIQAKYSTSSLNFSGAGGATFVGPVAAAAITATSFAGNGASITSLNASNLTSGTVPTARLGSGTANGSTYLAGDQTFKATSTLLPQALGTTASPTFDRLSLAGNGYSDSVLKVNSLEFQTFSLNNAWISENVYYDGGGFRYRQSGQGGLFYFQGAEGQFRFCDYGEAGDSADIINPQFKVNADGTVALGGSIGNNTGDYSGASTVIDAYAATFNVPLTITRDNSDYSDDPASATLLINNTNYYGQNIIGSIIGDSVVAKWRTDYAGNITWSAGNTDVGGSHDFWVGGDYPNGTEVMQLHGDGIHMIAPMITFATGGSIADDYSGGVVLQDSSGDQLRFAGGQVSINSNTLMDSTGFYLVSSGGNLFKLTVDDAGTLGTELVGH